MAHFPLLFVPQRPPDADLVPPRWRQFIGRYRRPGSGWFGFDACSALTIATLVASKAAGNAGRVFI